MVLRPDTESGSSKLPESETAAPVRKIIHVDMDAFYASVEQRDNPELRGKPVAVGGSSQRGVVAAASYEARKFGVHSAMASVTAKRKCPDLIFVRHRFEVYTEISRQIREIFAEYTDLIEPLSLDEAYLDVTENHKGIETATQIAEEIRAKIKAATQLTASAGVSYNKFLAKIASDYRKPDGLFVITPKQGPAFVKTLPVTKFHGVGPATAAKMQKLGIETGADLKERPLEFLREHFGKAGAYFHWVARGIDNRPVRPSRTRKSVGAENTLAIDLDSLKAAGNALQPIIDKLWRHCEKSNIRGRTITLKVKFSNFTIITRSRTVNLAIDTRDMIDALTSSLLSSIFPIPRPIRLLGISLSGLEGDSDLTEDDINRRLI